MFQLNRLTLVKPTGRGWHVLATCTCSHSTVTLGMATAILYSKDGMY